MNLQSELNGRIGKQPKIRISALMAPNWHAAKRRVAGSEYGGRGGCLLGVGARREDYRYQSWQFRSDGTPVPEMRDVLAILREHGAGRDHGRRTSGWREVDWLRLHSFYSTTAERSKRSLWTHGLSSSRPLDAGVAPARDAELIARRS